MTPQERQAIRECALKGGLHSGQALRLLDEIDDFLKAEQVWQQSSLERALENKRLSDEVDRLRGALEVYAREENWNNEKLTEPDGCVWIRSSWMGDDAYGHTVARQALEADTK